MNFYIYLHIYTTAHLPNGFTFASRVSRSDEDDPKFLNGLLYGLLRVRPESIEH